MSLSSSKRTRIGQKVRSSSLRAEPTDGESERQIQAPGNKLNVIEFKTMMAPPFEEDTMFPTERNGSSSNWDTATQFCGLKQTTDMRSGCDNEVDGLRNDNNNNNIWENTRLVGSNIVGLNKKQVGTSKLSHLKLEQVEESFPFPSNLSISLSLDNRNDSLNNRNNNHDELELSLNRSSNHSITSSNERAREQTEQEEDRQREREREREKNSVQQHSSSLLLSDNRRETRNRRRFSSLIKSEPIESKSPSNCLLSLVRNKIDKEEEEIDELSPLQKVNKKSSNKIRERSSSTTSDYYSSSSHESPVNVSSNTNQQSGGGKKCILSLFRESEKSSRDKEQVSELEKLSSSRVESGAKIYENPAFDLNNEIKDTHLRTKQGNSKNGEEQEEEMKGERQDQTNKGQQKKNSSSSRGQSSVFQLKTDETSEKYKSLSGGQKCVKMEANEQHQKAGQRTSVTHSNYSHSHDSGAATALNSKHHSRRQQRGEDNNLAPLDDSQNHSALSNASSSSSSSSSPSSASLSSSTSSTPTTASISQSISSAAAAAAAAAVGDKQPLNSRAKPLDGAVSAAHSSPIDYVTFPLLPHDSTNNNNNTNSVLHKQYNPSPHSPNHNNYSSSNTSNFSNLYILQNTNNNRYLSETGSGQIFNDNQQQQKNSLNIVESSNSNQVSDTSERRRRRNQSTRRQREPVRGGDFYEHLGDIDIKQTLKLQQLNHARQLRPVMQTRQQNQQQYQQRQLGSGENYYAPPSQQSAEQINSLTSSQPTTCDESPLGSSNNTDESNRVYLNSQFAISNSHFQQQQVYNSQDSDYHYYQVVVPEETNERRHVDDGTRLSCVNKIDSPCKSIGRMVSSLFNNHQQQNNQQQSSIPSVTTIDQNLIKSEPLIRSSSWQNKTLIDLNRQTQQQQQVLPFPPPLPCSIHHMMESTVGHQKTLPSVPYNNTLTRHHQQQPQQYPPISHGTLGPMRNNSVTGIELAQIEPNKEAHFYCGVATLRQQQKANSHHARNYENPPTLDTNQSQYNLNPSTNALNQSFQTLVNEQKYPINSFAYPRTDYVNNGMISNSKLNPTGRTIISGSSSDSTLNARFDRGRCKKQSRRKQVSPVCCNLLKSTKLCFLLFLLSASACFLLVALLSNYNPTGRNLDNNSELTTPTPTTTLTTQTSIIDKDLSQLMAIQQQRRFPFVNTSEIKQLNQQQQQQMINPLDYYGNSTNYQQVAPPGVSQTGQNSVIITSPYQQKAPNSIQTNNNLATTNQQTAPLEQPSLGATTQLPFDFFPPQPSTQIYWASNEQILEMEQQGVQNNYQCLADSNSNNNNNALECNLKGFCDKNAAACFCFPGFSGPTCTIANCPNDCSHRGDCKLNLDHTITNLGTSTNNNPNRAYLSSLSFQTLFQSRWRNSICPKSVVSEQELSSGWAKKLVKDMPNNSHFSYTYDNRLEWQCVCQAGFTGPDCSQLRELQCNNEKDDDLDGLSDCEDDDCCSQSVCRDNHMCFKSPEPTKVLESLEDLQNLNNNNNDLFLNEQNNISHDRFYIQMRFLIANESVQSYAQERMFDKNRVAVIRGKVVKSSQYNQDSTETPRSNSDRGIVSARVSVEDNDQFGFTLTRNDGYFDMLVNGNEWITLQFHRNAYVPIKKKIFVKAYTINSLEEDIEMWLSPKLTTPSPVNTLLNFSSGTLLSSYNPTSLINTLQHPSEQKRLDCSFNVQLSAKLYKLATNLKRNDERKRNQLFECLLNEFVIQPVSKSIASNQRFKYEPLIVLDDNFSSNKQEQLKSFVLSNSGAFQTELDKTIGEIPTSSPFNQIRFIYNSASFPPAASVVKPTLLIHLLPNKLDPDNHELQHQRLSAVIIQLDIEGQSRREKLKPLASLSYQYAWNRRNVYNQKVYGFSELNIRIGYEYELKVNKSVNLIWNDCLLGNLGSNNMQISESTIDKFRLPNILSSSYSDKKTVWFEQKVYIEAHQLNQHSDLGKWNLASSNRLDLDHQLIYFGSVWSLPYKLVYPPIVSDPISLIPGSQSQELPSSSLLINQRYQEQSYRESNVQVDPSQSGHLMTRGPNSSIFIIILAPQNTRSSNRLILVDSSRSRRLLDLPLGIITGKLGISSSMSSSFSDENEVGSKKQPLDDIQILYNNYLSTLYVSSKIAGKIVQVSYSSLLVLNKTLASGSSTLAPEDEVDIEPLAGFERQTLASTNSPGDAIKAAKQTRLVGPHSMSLDEDRQILYFIDGPTNLMALDLSTNHVILLPALVIPYRAQQNSSNKQQSNNCHRDSLKTHLKDYKPYSMHNLVWSKQDSSLYFVDQNVIFSLRQDLTLEIIVASPHQKGSPPIIYSCFAKLDLGQIKSLLIDEVNNDLLIVHQWFDNNNTNTNTNDGKRTISMSQSGKLSGRFYLAKVKVGIRSSIASGRNSVRRLIDLHSPTSAWDPMILKMAPNQAIRQQSLNLTNEQQTNSQSINWMELATIRSHQPSISPTSSAMRNLDGGPSGGSNRKIPFIHLSRGFKRIDSIEINSDGSIFVLDSSSNSIRLIEPYSPISPELNQVIQRQDANINRVFAINNEHQIFEAENDNESGRKLSVVNMVNPISGDIMEFHAVSGLQLSLTKNLDGGKFKSEFYYKILNNNNNMLDLDEDDRYDFNVQRLIYNYNNQISPSDYVRLNRIDDSAGNQYEFIRSSTGSRFVLKSIQFNQQTICEIATDYLGVLNTYQPTGKAYRLEIVYDSLTYLLHDLVTKEENSPSSSLPNQLVSHNYEDNSPRNRSRHLGWVKTKRIIYDKIFYHPCDLFEVSA